MSGTGQEIQMYEIRFTNTGQVIQMYEIRYTNYRMQGCYK